MCSDFLLETDRLILRSWKDEDIDAFAGLCADPVVMRYFPETLSREKAKRLISMGQECFDEYGVFYAPVELKETGEFIGFVGLDVHSEAALLPFAPCVDIGWRLKQSAWGKGYASEAARAWIRFGFETKCFNEIVSFTPLVNVPSQKVMERIGMRRDPEGDFVHSYFEPDHDLALHCLYRISRKELS
ncbi:MAG: GNAT family N-acetyltransferase [Roseibium sp.]|uniref:GNAT family N-acetyltransferase n=1 Tax=Roseibium sp. TaxID=1936156 RepID=UPI00261F28CE|nr:GNAT family N-acetyltransferase [Roseibium sp.]MCV0428883.1 GNAT family N-acetyltransferase [Roseibium sp.]